VARILKEYPNRPSCICCGKPAHMQNYNKITGKYTWRKYCLTCHTERRKNYRNKIINFDPRKRPTCSFDKCRKRVTILGTDELGNLKFSDYCKTHNSTPNHLRYRKNYCENIDGRLGFKCTTTIFWEGMLQVDHIDGNPYNEPEDGSNFQTFCGCCHAYKTWKEKDYLTPGRKSFKKKC
jgi:hypothetical protein